MKYLFIDDSIHDEYRGNFILSAFVFINSNPENWISSSLIRHGYNPLLDEFKSGVNFRKHPNMTYVRNDLKSIIQSNCKIGLAVLPRNRREDIGIESLKAFKQFLNFNHFKEGIEVFIDSSYFKDPKSAQNIVEELGIQNHTYHFEQDSIHVKGIQLADLVAHTASTMLLETMGHINKQVKAGENSGYDPDMDIELGFELWATIRYSLISKPKEKINHPIDESTYDVFPYGLYVSEYCDLDLVTQIKNRFGGVYLGCIH
ncbi:DUF3800 domain-containing protein [Reichenbachiella sp. MSK19-1]|uniref:DUF3800 domain-containing protein n=1 Tax=Reichenbachiella sp. MSK19-1 TaxID=1897631 RepID=UPI000E6B9917|nr:DUF3800 domain-containing protein [Reichenbachiella sp. MSK19-1]RJE70929.1 hypothetical protein BGP76_09100 [Reichenbachiella sp. MSK19-1]